MEKRKRYEIVRITAAVLLLTALFFYLLFYAAKHVEKNRPRVFGSTYMTMNNPYFSALNESIRNIVEANGDILITRDPAQNQQRQNEQILEMIDEGMSVLFANAVDWEEIEPALAACREAGVDVFVVDTKVENNDEVVSVIESDNYHAGELVALDLMKKLPDGGDIVVMNHYNVYSTVERRQGFLDVLSGHPEYRIVSETHATSEIEVGTREMNRILKEGVRFDAVLGCNDPTAQGAIAGLQMNDIEIEDEILIYGVDGSPDMKSMINRGIAEGTVAQYPIRMGKIAAETAYEYLSGKEVPKSVLVDVNLITRANLSEFDINGWQ
ncbi:MAG: sugar ABC transporter substrate-binding protein [Eubacteriales bacterium]|nr:sugar ABC transporter substrate-binding protein [Eubacteriales bacterium]